MTIGSWILVGLIFGIAFGSICYIILNFDSNSRGAAFGCSCGILIVAAVLCGAICWYSTGTAVGQRAYKDQLSNFSGGILRVVSVYDINGKLIKQYRGKFDVETDRGGGAKYILFDDENNKRHIVYYTTSTITIDEE